MPPAYPSATTEQLSSVLEHLRSASVPLVGFLKALGSCDPATLLSNADRQDITDLNDSLSSVLIGWAESDTNVGKTLVNAIFDHVETTCAQEVRSLTELAAGFHFNASNATEDGLKKVRVKHLASAIRTNAPRVWSLLDRLMNADGSVTQERMKKRRRRAQGGTSSKRRVQRRGVDVEVEDTVADDEDSDWEDIEEGEGQDDQGQDDQEERRRRIIEMDIKPEDLECAAESELSSGSDSAQGVIDQAPLLEGTSEPAPPPQTPASVPADPGSAASSASTSGKKITLLDLLAIIRRTDRRLSMDFYDGIGPEYFSHFRKELDKMKPEVVDAIPLTKSEQVPLHAMDINPELNLSQKPVMAEPQRSCQSAPRVWDSRLPCYRHMPKYDFQRSSASKTGVATSHKQGNKRDLHYENMLLQQQLFLLYEETAYAMNMGDIGRVETCFLPWAFIFQGCGKHKYAGELYRYLKNVWFIYPPGLRKAIRYSILVNPTGKPGKWRGIDWVIEHNNLSIKRIYGGRFSNRKKKRIFIEAALIEVYKTIRIDFEDMYCLNQRSLRHAPPDMRATFRKLRLHMQANQCHMFIRGRRVPYIVPDASSKGMSIAMSKKSEVIFSDVIDTTDGEWAGCQMRWRLGRMDLTWVSHRSVVSVGFRSRIA
ncbi:hypothetical protein NMY22_g13775 [Coprinellus aureogranulatus]|nr:hypothetical protein NMY22_g13775 [Coprinellus aureogranulatus]